MIELIPAILTKDFVELGRQLEHLRGVAPLVQIDLVGTNILEGHTAMPLWEEFDFEFDSMLPDPRAAMQSCIDLGASRIVVHTAAEGARAAVEFLQPMREGEFAVAVGVALRAHSAPEELERFAGLYDYVQVMGIDHEGKQGQPPDPHHRELQLIRQLRSQFPDLIIQVDGAVAPHIRELAQAGASRLVVGSAIVGADNPAAVYKTLYTEANT